MLGFVGNRDPQAGKIKCRQFMLGIGLLVVEKPASRTIETRSTCFARALLCIIAYGVKHPWNNEEKRLVGGFVPFFSRRNGAKCLPDVVPHSPTDVSVPLMWRPGADDFQSLGK